MADNSKAKATANTNDAPEPNRDTASTEELNSQELDQISGGFRAPTD